MKQLALIILTSTLISCTEKDQVNAYVEVLDNNKSGVPANDTDFLIEALKFNLQEINLSQLAQENSINPVTKNTAKQFENSHSLLYNELIQLADKKNITVPSKNKTDTDKKNLKNEIGDDFDELYFIRIVNDYKYSVERFEYASHNSKDHEIALWAKTAVPVLRRNLGLAIKLQADLKKNKKLK